jgi:hypothetical protein
VLAFTGIVGAPLIWLTALQTGYVLAYQACDSQSRWWVAVPTAGFFAVTVLALAAAYTGRRRARDSSRPHTLIADIGLGVAAFMVLVMAASLMPLILRPCD